MRFLRAIAHWLHHTTGSGSEVIHIYLGDLIWRYRWGWDLSLFGSFLTWNDGTLTWAVEGEDKELVLYARRPQ